jgi:uncharacterized protein DUF1592/uncharacterized protein DUF1588/uncharacterized protein DUF1585/uncharacterized protein DUF1587/uncharacterized protein DUF1595/cytochrome c
MTCNLALTPRRAPSGARPCSFVARCFGGFENGSITEEVPTLKRYKCRSPMLQIFVHSGFVLCVAGFLSELSTKAALVPPPKVANFIQTHCVECHDADAKKGGLDLTSLDFDLKNPQDFSRWVSVDDKVSAGEMPPKKKARPAAAELKGFTNYLSSALLTADLARVANEGRATERRLNRYEYENTLRDLLSLPYLEVKAFLPEDREAFGFNKVGQALDVSHVQMARYLTAADFALRQALAPQATRPELTTNRYYTWDQGEFFGAIKLEGPENRRTFPLVGLELQTNLMVMQHPKRTGPPDPQRREQESMAVVVSTYEPTEIRFGRFHAPVTGRYRLRFSAYSIWMGPKYKEVSAGHRAEPVTIYSDTPPRLLRKLGSFDVNPEPTVREIQVWLLAGETIRPDAARFFRSRPPDHKNPLAGPDGMPGLAFQWMQVEGPLVDQWPPPGHQLLFGDLPIKNGSTKSPGEKSQACVDVISKNPESDAQRLMHDFMRRAYRMPVADAEAGRFLAIVKSALKSGYSFTDAMIAGYTGVLCSPGFLYLDEKPGHLDDLALASRLSYFLWNSPPDAQLRELAERGELHRRKVLSAQTDRLLNDSKSRRFVEAFLNYWLDLRLIEGTAPDEELYPEYQLDDLLVESVIGETQSFFSELIRRNLGVTNLVSSDFAMLNERLAAHYGIGDVEGVRLRSIPLKADCVRGGLLTQASVLKVTANGTTTSPVKRGAWIMTRLLGKPPPPPPPNVPALEPDIRGATTIRAQLSLHRNQETCAACHRNIDPAGFALENFDVMGGWRDRYRSSGQGDPVEGIGHNGLNFHYCLGPTVDPSGELPDGRRFQNVAELKELLLKDDEQLARNLTRQLVIYATGAPIQFSDRPQIGKILAHTRPTGYGVRSLIHEIVQSDLFLNK